MNLSIKSEASQMNRMLSQISGADTIPKGLDPRTDIVHSSRINPSQKLEPKYFLEKRARNPNRVSSKSNVIGPKKLIFFRIEEKKEVDGTLDSCRYDIDDNHILEKKDTIKIPFEIPTPEKKRVGFSKSTSKVKKTEKKKIISDQNKNSNSSKGIMKKGTLKSRDPSLSRLTHKSSQDQRFVSPEVSRVTGFNDACKVAFKGIIHHHKDRLKHRKKSRLSKESRASSKRHLNVNKYLDKKFGRSLQPDNTPKQLKKKKSALFGRVGFLDDPFFDKVEFDENGFVITKRDDKHDIISRKSEF